MSWTDKNKYKCGDPIVPSACIPYTGKELTFLSEEDALPCDANLNEVIDRFDIYLKKLVDANDFSTLDKDCFDFDPATVTAVQLHQMEITEICLQKGQIESLQTIIENLNIGAEIITIDLGCMTPEAADCAVDTNQYSLQTILQILAAKVCNHETRISNIES